MRKFAFRLNSVLRLKEQLLHQSQRRLAAIAEQQKACDERMEKLRVELRQIPLALAKKEATQDWEVNFRYAKLVEQRLEAAQQQWNQLRDQWLAERVVYQQADQEAESLRKLKAKQKSEYAYEMDRQESADIEEHILRGWTQDGEVRS